MKNDMNKSHINTQWDQMKHPSRNGKHCRSERCLETSLDINTMMKVSWCDLHLKSDGLHSDGLVTLYLCHRFLVLFVFPVHGKWKTFLCILVVYLHDEALGA